MLESIARSFIYYPETGLQETPAHIGLDFEDVWLRTADGLRVHAWFVPGDSAITWLWFHGNGGNLSTRLENLRRLHARLGVSVLLVSYRGYGLSEGVPSEEGTYEDARASLRHLLERPGVDNNRIVYFGRSLGGAVAAKLATERPPTALVLESSFPSLARLAPRHFPWLGLPVLRRLLPFNYGTAGHLKAVRAPVLIMHGGQDDIVPIQFGREVFQAAREPKEWHEVQGAGHNDVEVVGGDAYYGTLERFLQRHVQ